MAALLDRNKRIQNKQLKKERIEKIVKAAHRAFLSFPYFEVTLDSIRKMADVPQGKPELYFGSREDLFLRVLASASKGWAEELENILQTESETISSDQAAEILMASVQLHPDFFRLRGFLPMVLEQGLETASVMALTNGMKENIRSCAAALERRCPDIGQESGTRLLLLLHAYASSLYQIAYESSAMNRLWNDADSSGYRVKFLNELQTLCETLVAQAALQPD